MPLRSGAVKRPPGPPGPDHSPSLNERSGTIRTPGKAVQALTTASTGPATRSARPGNSSSTFTPAAAKAAAILSAGKAAIPSMT